MLNITAPIAISTADLKDIDPVQRFRKIKNALQNSSNIPVEDRVQLLESIILFMLEDSLHFGDSDSV